MAIEQRPHCCQQTLRRTGANGFHHSLLPILDECDGLASRALPIGQQFRYWSPMVLECYEAVMIFSCSSEIESLRSDQFRLDNRSPKQKRHYTQVVKSFVGTAVLVIALASEMQYQNGRQGD